MEQGTDNSVNPKFDQHHREAWRVSDRSVFRFSPKGSRADKAVWTRPELTDLGLGLSSVSTGNNYYIDGSNANNLARKS